jgi:hypothetical protein
LGKVLFPVFHCSNIRQKKIRFSAIIYIVTMGFTYILRHFFCKKFRIVRIGDWTDHIFFRPINLKLEYIISIPLQRNLEMSRNF